MFTQHCIHYLGLFNVLNSSLLADLFIPTPFVLIWESDFVMSLLYVVSSVSWRATPRTVMFLRTKTRVVVGYGLSEEFKVNIG